MRSYKSFRVAINSFDDVIITKNSAEEERNEDAMHLCFFNDAEQEWQVGRGLKERCKVCSKKLQKKIRINLRNFGFTVKMYSV